MRQLAVRGFDDELGDRIRRLARSRRISLNQAVLLLLRRGAGLEVGTRPRDVIGSSLDRFIGDGTPEEGAELERAVAVFEAVDEDAWK
jgi:hypothetical protein